MNVAAFDLSLTAPASCVHGVTEVLDTRKRPDDHEGLA